MSVGLRMFDVSEPAPPDDSTATIAATVTGLAAFVAFGGVLYEFWFRKTIGWHTGLGWGKWATRIGAVVALAGLGILSLNVGAKLVHRWKGRLALVVTALLALLFGALCLMDETVRAETAILFDGSGSSRPWELSLVNDPNAWLRYQLLRGCGAACVVLAFGLMGATIRSQGTAKPT